MNHDPGHFSVLCVSSVLCSALPEVLLHLQPQKITLHWCWLSWWSAWFLWLSRWSGWISRFSGLLSVWSIGMIMNHESFVVFEAKYLLPENREQLWKVVRLPKSDLMVGAGSINWEGGWMTVNAGVGGNSYSPAAEPCNNFQQDNAMSSNACHSLNHNIMYPFLHTWKAIIPTMSVFIWLLKISNIVVSSKFEFESNLLLTEEVLFLRIRQLHIQFAIQSICLVWQIEKYQN